MSAFQAPYHVLGGTSEDDDEEGGGQESPPIETYVHVPQRRQTRWNHIKNLDEFFSRVYEYHQRNGFVCMVVADLMQIVQFVFMLVLSFIVLNCVDYSVLFDGDHQVSLGDAIRINSESFSKMSWFLVLFYLAALLAVLFRCAKTCVSIFNYWEMRCFYHQALVFDKDPMQNLTWHQVLQRLMEVQKDHQMCIHKHELTQLDIYHRILRFKNYMVAMVNKSVLPLVWKIPLVGEHVFMSNGLKYTLDFVFFWGYGCPFENYWHLKADYKNANMRRKLAEDLTLRFRLAGILHAIFGLPLLLWQVLYVIYRYTELIRNNAGAMGMRSWSLYARLYLRHFNELDHELDARFTRAYKPAVRYMESFNNPLLVILSKYIVFMSSALLGMLILLTLIEESFLHVRHIILFMSVLGVMVALFRSLIPDENMVNCPDLLMRAILAHINYMPASWRGRAHTTQVRDEFGLLFQYRFVDILEEVFSPIITPLLLLFSYPKKSEAIVDFFRNFSVEVAGVGDVCSFAQMDVRRHGNAEWQVASMEEPARESDDYAQAEDGKTEMSLVHFLLTNPEWQPQQTQADFVQRLKQTAHQEAASLHQQLTMDNALSSSLDSLNFAYHSMASSGTLPSYLPAMSGALQQMSVTPGLPPLHRSASSLSQSVVVGRLNRTEGPLRGSGVGLLASLQPTMASSMNMYGGGSSTAMSQFWSEDESTRDLNGLEMSMSALYLHDLRFRRSQPSSPPSRLPMPNIDEEIVDRDSEYRPLLASSYTQDPSQV